MKRYLTATFIVTLVAGILQTPPAQAQIHTSDIVKVGAITGGLFGTYSALVCQEKGRCSQRTSWATLGAYTGAGIGTFVLFHNPMRRPLRQPEPVIGSPRIPSFLKNGDHVAVRDASGHVSDGTIETVSESALRLRVGNSSRDFAVSDVSEISQRRHSINSGSMIHGFAFGLLAGAVAIPNTNSGKWCTGKGAGTCVIGTAALGGALFAGVSAIPRKKQTIFSQSTLGRPTGIDFNIAPLLSKGRRGASLTVSF